jgi:hypothetical protein
VLLVVVRSCIRSFIAIEPSKRWNGLWCDFRQLTERRCLLSLTAKTPQKFSIIGLEAGTV